MSAGPRTQFDLVEDFWQKLLAADDRVMARARAGAARRRVRRTLVLAVLAILALAALGFAARALLTGEDAPRVFPGQAQVPSIGPPRPGTVALLPDRALDPADGVAKPPWGLRLYYTEADAACLQFGRVVGGRLVALGTAGAFGNDGLAHRLPLEAEACGRVVDDRRPLLGGSALTDTSAVAAHEPARPDDARTVVYGLAQPGVTSTALVTESTRQVRPVTDRRLGTYLFVLAGPLPERLDVVGTYPDGERCLVAAFGHTSAPAAPEPCLYRRPAG
jgi:hypothetical protein